MRGASSSREPAGDELAAWLADGYAPAYRTAFLLLHNRADAEEAVQDAFLRAWRFRAAVPPGDSVQPWLYRVVVNACLSKLRASGRQEQGRQRVPDGWDCPSPGDDGQVSGPEASVLELESRGAVLEALADLPDHLRVVMVLRYYAQLNEREIASVIHRRPGTVKSRLHNARDRLSRDPRLTQLAAGGDLDIGREA